MTCTNTMSKWSKIYETQLAEAGSVTNFIKNKISYKKQLIEIIKTYCNKNGRILEIGSGSGVTTIHLNLSGYKTIGVDQDPDMINFARSISGVQKDTSTNFEIDNLRTLNKIKGYFDVIFSNGVMEHFTDNDIIKIINRHLLMCHYLIFSIPSDYFSMNQRIYGDERFMNAKKWHQIISRSNGICLKEFSFSADNSIKGKPQFIGFVLNSKPARALSEHRQDS